MYNILLNHHICKRLITFFAVLCVAAPVASFAQSNSAVQMVKRNASGFAIDGNRGGENAQDVYLWDENESNVNQQWIEISRGNGYYSYQKVNTAFCLDGGRGGANRQNIYLWECVANNQNQQWLKVDVGSGHYRLEKRNAPGFSIDGNGGGVNGQSIYLWESSNRNQNQHWSFNIVGDGGGSGGGGGVPTVSSLEALSSAIQASNQNIKMSPGNYNIADLPTDSRNLLFSGSNNTIDLSGVNVEVPVGSTAASSYITMEGSNNTLLGGTFEDTYNNGTTDVSDFVAYNLDRDNLAYGLRGQAVMTIVGNDNVIDGIKLTIRGSFPFGYGSRFGIGGTNSFGLSKRCGILIRGVSNTIQNSEVQQLAFCHGIYMQDRADDTLIRNVLVEGSLRATNDMLAETSTDSLAFRASYLDADGNPIPRNQVDSLAEDGIRSYTGTGSVTVENSTVRRMRGGIRLYLGSGATVRNSTAVDNGNTNFNLPRNASVTNSTGNFRFAPLNDHRLGRSGQDIEMTILPSPNAVGPHNIADINGNSHNIVFRRANGPLDSDETRAIVVNGNNSTIRNETEYRIILSSGTSGNIVVSAGPVTDNGSNSVRSINLDI